MSKTIDLSKLSLKELQSLQKDIVKAIAANEAKRLSDARKAIQDRASELGYSLKDLVGGNTAKKPPLPAKYRDPNNAENTWSGRGRRPQWVVEALGRGKKLDDLSI